MRKFESQPAEEATHLHPLRLKRLHLETQHEPIVLMHTSCPVARSEGFAARAKVELEVADRSAMATLYFVADGGIETDEVGVSEAVWHRLGVPDGSEVKVHHSTPLASMSDVRAKVYGHRLDAAALHGIMSDIVAERYSDVQLATFVTAFSTQPADISEIIALTRAMVEVGDSLKWGVKRVFDKHSVGGLPANRTTPLIVSIVAAAGLTIPKTSSRAITSPSGTADTMETMTPVELDLPTLRRVVEREGGCLAWGGSVRLSPADDILIRVERALDLDCPAQLVASVLSKKIAAGSTEVLLDLPIGPTAKIRTLGEARQLSEYLKGVAAAFGMQAQPVFTDGSQPVGNGIGPSLEAKDVLAVLRNESDAPADLRARAVLLAGSLLEMGGAAEAKAGERVALELLTNGNAYSKFLAICEAQGGFREPGTAPYFHVIKARQSGIVSLIDNRLLSRLAKLAGAPASKAAGLKIHTKLGQLVEKGQPLLTVYGESRGELDYALTYAASNIDIVEVRPQ